MSRRARILIVAVVALVAAIGVGRLALPAAIRWAVAGQLTALTGLETTGADIDLSVLARRVVAHDVVLGAAEGQPRLASIPRVEVALRLPPLFRGRVSVERLVIEAPEVGIVRFASGETNLDTLVGADAALERSGQAAPFADPFLVDLQGELRGFALPRTTRTSRTSSSGWWMDEAGIQPERLRVSDARVPPGAPGAPRVEFDFAPRQASARRPRIAKVIPYRGSQPGSRWQ